MAYGLKACSCHPLNLRATKLFLRFSFLSLYIYILTCLKELAMIFAGQENPFIIFKSKDIYIYFQKNNEIPINLLEWWRKTGFW